MQFVRVDVQYIRALKKVDFRVQTNDPAEEKENKPFLGILFHRGGAEYFVPLSSPKPKHATMNNSRDFHKVLDAKGNLLSVINFNNMIPVVPALYKRVEFAHDKDRTLLGKEYAFCKENGLVLMNKAKILYNRYKAGLLTSAEMERTVNFSALEAAMQDYLSTLQPATDAADSSIQAAPETTSVSAALSAVVSNMPAQPGSASTLGRHTASGNENE